MDMHVRNVLSSLFLALVMGGCGIIFPDTEFEWSIVWWVVGGVLVLAVGMALFSTFGGSKKDDE